MAGRHPRSVPIRHRTAVAACIVVGALVGGGACSSGPERSADAFCPAYVEVAEQAAGLGDPDDLAVVTLRERVADIDRAASNAHDRAPEEIADTVADVIAPLHTLRDDLDDADDRDAVMAALATYAQATGTAGADQTRLDEWTGTHCGVVSVTTTTVPATVAPGLTG